MKNIFSKSLQLVRQHLRAYILFNVLFYGVMCIAIIYSNYNPGLHERMIMGAQSKVNNGIYSYALEYYSIHPNFIMATLSTFLINFILGAFGLVSLPSYILPFAGSLYLIPRFIAWGLTFPATWSTWYLSLPVPLLEGQGYILAAFSVYVFETRFLMPKRFNIKNHREGFLIGLKLSSSIYLLIAIVLFISAIVEVSTVFSVTAKNPFQTHIKANIGLNDDSVKTSVTHSRLYFDKNHVPSDVAKVSGVLLEDIRYFGYDGKNEAKLSQRDSCYAVEIGIQKSLWNDSNVNKRFKILLNKLHTYYPAAKFEIVEFDVDSSGTRNEKIFK